MDAVETAKAAPARCGSDLQNAMLGGSRSLNNPSLARDQRLLSLDFLGELGDQLVVAGAALAAAASVENVSVVEMALRHARATLLEAIAEFKVIAPGGAGQ